jgi:hypothetical protein
MAQPPAADLDVLRRRLTAPERAFLDTLWAFYCDHNRWAPARLFHQHVGRTAAQAHLASLGDGVVQTYRDTGKPYYRLTFLGVLLAGQGEESEGLLVRYLEYVRDRYRADPFVEWVGSQEVEAALHLRGEQSRLLRRLIRLSHWWGGGSAFGERDWTVGVPIDVDDLLAEADLSRYVREHVLRHFPVAAQANAAPAENGAAGGAFWFVADARLRERLAADWHEAQDVCHVLGWKSCVVLCGGILEAVLADALTRAGAVIGRGRASLTRLVAAAAERRLLAQDSVQIGSALAAFPTLVHPARSSRAAAALTRTEAEAALEAVRGCLRQLAAATSASSRPAGR